MAHELKEQDGTFVGSVLTFYYHTAVDSTWFIEHATICVLVNVLHSRNRDAPARCEARDREKAPE